MTDKSIVPQKAPITSHVLDTSSGKPAANLPVSLFQFVDQQWTLLKKSETNGDGRCNDLVGIENFTSGRYKVHFFVSQYFETTSTKSMYPFVEIVFDIENPLDHYHIPLLLSPFGYTTYRGS
ncbi:5-hydroxyisourate hydrolase-like [Belonocnema kinseyi]|uniref:5-hydroxyisourate hydrolase-like n=1 Tax=Belonocnema kinseyi TaxID=2817044 RepID=UPI00143D0ECF|nr:5-hydroxyisourate hydrolase-like [Belonocnema kinseyi]